MTVCAPGSFAQEEKADPGLSSVALEGGDAVKEIVRFAPLKKKEYYYDGKPAAEDLLAELPEKLEVELEGGNEAVKIPVEWEFAEDYSDTDFYFYSARPVWEEGFTLASRLDPRTDVPWVTLFRSDVKGGLSLAAGLSKDAKTEKIYNYLTKTMGLNMAAACGVMTNLYAESGMQSNNLENTYNIRYGLSDKEYTRRVNKGKKNKGKYRSGYGTTRYFTTDYSGYGICQWTTSGRRTKLLNAAVKKDVSIANMKMQLGVLRSELKGDYPQVWATLQNVPNNAAGVYLAAAHFCNSFEIPANTRATAASRGRTALSTFWKLYSGKTAAANKKSFLGICGYTYPKNIKKGTGMTVSGQVISNYTVKSVTAKIVNKKGKTVYSSTKKPNAGIFSLYAFDSKMLFRKLPKGSYTYSIKAKDSSGKTVTVKHTFTVKPDQAPDILRGCATKDCATSSK